MIVKAPTMFVAVLLTAVLTAAGGLVWGPVLGIFYTIIGENLSAAVAFWIARHMGGEWIKSTRLKWIEGIDKQAGRSTYYTGDAQYVESPPPKKARK